MGTLFSSLYHSSQTSLVAQRKADRAQKRRLSLQFDSSMPVTGQPLKHILKPRRVAERDDMALACGIQRFARPVAHQAACAFDDGDECRKVMDFKASLNDDVDMPAGEQAIIIAIPAPTGRANLFHDVLEAMVLRLVKILRAG